MISSSSCMRDVFAFENHARSLGYMHIAGVDEAGRGPLAGPVVAAACIVQEGFDIEGVDDSKALTAKQREVVYRSLCSSPYVAYGIGIVHSDEIDRINILQATFKAMESAVNNLPTAPNYILVDGSLLPKWSVPSRAIVKGDSLSFSISAASIIAKQTRDHLMDDMDKLYPGYGFAKHKGYGTKAHMEAIRLLGPSPIHRMSFEPLKSNFS